MAIGAIVGIVSALAPAIPGVIGLIKTAEAAITGRGRGKERKAVVLPAAEELLKLLRQAGAINDDSVGSRELSGIIDLAVAVMNQLGALDGKDKETDAISVMMRGKVPVTLSGHFEIGENPGVE